MGISRILMNYANGIKPLLKKLIPASILKKSKQIVLQRITKQIEEQQIIPYQPGIFAEGINLIGSIESATGLGQSFRLLERVFDQLGQPFLIYNYAQNTKNRIDISDYKNKIQDRLKYSVNLWHVNPSDFAEVYAAMGRESFDKRYNIAFWLWELEDFPDEWVPYIHLLDEIWTPSEFISESIRKKTEKPVYTVPYCVTAKADTEKYGRKYFGLPEDRFLFLMMYDAQSIKERKNPEGVIRAFQKAFSSQDQKVGLVIKVNSADNKELSYIRQQIGIYHNIYLLNRNLEKIQVNSLIACVDVFVSLHRAEGFGLVLAEAMLNKVPTIATNWSANTEFMNTDSACMVGYHMKELEKDYPPYKKGSRWADPDIKEAAAYMRRLASDREYYIKIAEAGHCYAQYKLGMDGVKHCVFARLQEIKNGR